MIDRLLKNASSAVGGTHIPNPLWDKLWVNPVRRFGYWIARRYRPKKRGDRDLVTVHPLGGCPMGADASQGVVNHRHQVFSASSGSAVHENLYVMDGSIIPEAVGRNPTRTIGALAERAARLMN